MMLLLTLMSSLVWALLLLIPPPQVIIVEGFSAPTKKSASNHQRQPSRVKPIPYIATASVLEQERAIQQLVREGDRVLLLGGEERLASLVNDAVGSQGKAVLVTVGQTTAAATTTTVHQEVDSFHHIAVDSFSQWRLAMLQDWPEASATAANETKPDLPFFNVLVLDGPAMMGNDLVLTCLSTIQEYVSHAMLRHCRPRAVLVKSKATASLARRLIAAPRLMDGTVTLNLTADSTRRETYVVAAVGVQEYRRTIPHVVRQGDVCLEVGCYCVGVDIGPKIIARAQREHPDIHFAVGNGFQFLELLRIIMNEQRQHKRAPTTSHNPFLRGCDVVYADIGGLSGPDGLLEALSLLEGLSNALRPRCIVIKSLAMRRLALSLGAFAFRR